MSRRAIPVSLGFVVAFTVWSSAQLLPPQQQPAQAPVFRATIDLVHLDVSVLDKNRHPVRDLKPLDFTITEDGKPQPIIAFSAVDVPANPPKPAVWSGRAVADVQSNEGMDDPQGRLFVLLMDDAMMPPVASTLVSAREVAKKFLDRITPNDRVAVVFSATGRNQGFTSDRARLVAAIDSLKVGHASHLMGWDTARDPKTIITIPNKANPENPQFMNEPEIPGPAGDPDMPFRSAAMETLQQVAATLISAPERRKALLEGVLVEALNVKTALFFLAFLPQFLVSDSSPVLQLVVMGTVCVMLNTLVDVGAVLGTARLLRLAIAAWLWATAIRQAIRPTPILSSGHTTRA